MLRGWKNENRPELGAREHIEEGLGDFYPGENLSYGNPLPLELADVVLKSANRNGTNTRGVSPRDVQDNFKFILHDQDSNAFYCGTDAFLDYLNREAGIGDKSPAVLERLLADDKVSIHGIDCNGMAIYFLHFRAVEGQEETFPEPPVIGRRYENGREIPIRLLEPEVQKKVGNRLEGGGPHFLQPHGEDSGSHEQDYSMTKNDL